MSTKKLYLAAVAVAAVVAAAVVSAAVLTRGGKEPAASTVTTLTQQPITGLAETTALFRGIPQHGRVLGSPRAPVTLVEYADPQCPYCAEWARNGLPAIVQDYVRSGRVRIEFRGLAFVGPNSRNGVAATLAAGKQGKLWQFADLLFANQGAENSGWISDDLFGAIVAGTDMSWKRFDLDRYDPAVTQQIANAYAQAQADGIQGTPSFFVGPTGGSLQQVHVTSVDGSEVQAEIDRLLAG